jgi:hypothetical protein
MGFVEVALAYPFLALVIQALAAHIKALVVLA